MPAVLRHSITRGRRANLLRQMLGRLSDNLEVAHNRILRLLTSLL